MKKINMENNCSYKTNYMCNLSLNQLNDLLAKKLINKKQYLETLGKLTGVSNEQK